jgi:hypothetical protein
MVGEEGKCDQNGKWHKVEVDNLIKAVEYVV